LLVFSDVGVGVAKDNLVSISGQKNQDAFLSAASFGYVVLFNERIVAVIGDRVKIEVERNATFESDSHSAPKIVADR